MAGFAAKPHTTTVVDPSDESQVKAVCVELGFFETTDGIQLQSVTGGITNQLFKASSGGRSVLVRCYGGEGLIDRDVELRTFAALCEHLTKPGFLGSFGNGRLEEFLEGHATLALDDMGTHAAAIAAKLAALHAFRVPDDLKPHHGSCGLWTTLDGWLAAAFDAKTGLAPLVARDPGCAGVFRRHGDVFDGARITASVERLRAEAEARAPELVFAHNDLLSGNLMVDEASGEIRIIDLEYGGVNYAAFDIANHFNEYAGGTGQPETALGAPDAARLPGRAAKEAWARAYLAARPTSAYASVDALLADVELFVVLDDFYWGLWAVCQATTEGCFDFPYLCYGKNRLRSALVGCAALEGSCFAFGVAVPDLGEIPKDAEGAVVLYDKWAATYDAALRSWGYAAPEMCAALVAEVNPRVGRLFDCGCGTGLAVDALRPALAAATSVVGGDISQASLDRCAARGYTATRRMDLEEPLPLEGDGFDAVVCVGVLSYVRDFRRLFAEWCRVTSPGGVVVFTHRAHLWRGDDGSREAARELEAAGTWTLTFASEPRPYMPNNPDPEERAKTIVCARFIVA